MLRILPFLFLGLLPLGHDLCAQSLTLIVTATNDDAQARDADPGDGVCEDMDGRCTLRAAIDEANASTGLDVTVVIPGLLPGSNTGKFTLSRVAPNVAFNTYEDDNAYGDLDLNGSFNSLLLQGTGTPGPTLSISPNDRILDVVSGGRVSVERIHFTGGTARAGRNGNSNGSGSFGVDGENGANGGAMRVAPGQEVTMDQVTFSSNFTQSGGNGAAPASSIARIDGGNGGSGGNGGALYIGEGADVTITRGTFSGNGTGDGGSPASGQSNGTPAEGGRGGNGGNGGAIYSAGALELLSCTITDNLGGDPTGGAAGVNGGEQGAAGEGGSGGGIALARFINEEQVTQGTATLLNTIVAGNVAGDDTEDGSQPGTDFYDNNGGKRFTSQGYNLIGTKNASGAFRKKEGDRIGNGERGIDPQLNGLNQNSDEAVPTRQPRSGSPVVNTGTTIMDNDFDARGFLRPAGGQADKGAHERNSEAFVTDLVITSFTVEGATEESVTITNNSDYPAQMDDHVLVAFPRGYDDAAPACLSVNLYGELAPGATFTVGDAAVSPKAHNLRLDFRTNTCGTSEADQFDDVRGALAIYKGGATSIQGFVLGNYEDVRKDLVTYGSSSARMSDSESLTATSTSLTATLLSYPNPADGLVTLSMSLPDAGTYDLRVLDAQGKKVLQRAVVATANGAQQLELDMTQLPGGIYLIQLTLPTEVLTSKLSLN
ncbi:hypothetical protein LEM8419_02455 [Neolewinella maritima]|uniref:Secretion system C-terminal sorting domain-containing protein n=1 Tax=Neolewinella maritima TaxID=1383882 RepID=A0ABM9B2H8_9BACT|nr:T9SS type A sorting domain-containing protein [Neolewinella maritima]CAH1001552.1 hypothetical protein LEM8419_02455 [Neolewinella maritima]